MMDMVRKEGSNIDLKILEKNLGVPVVPISTLRSEDLTELMIKAYETAKLKNH